MLRIQTPVRGTRGSFGASPLATTAGRVKECTHLSIKTPGTQQTWRFQEEKHPLTATGRPGIVLIYTHGPRVGRSCEDLCRVIRFASFRFWMGILAPDVVVQHERCGVVRDFQPTRAGPMDAAVGERRAGVGAAYLHAS